ncbi:MAG: transcription termination factor NusA [Candidatus Edwardsbacteria bacterium]
MSYELIEAINQIARQKNLDKNFLIETLKAGLLLACKRRFGYIDNIEVNIDEERGEIKLIVKKKIVEEVINPNTEISLFEAKEILKQFTLGEEIEEEISFETFGRGAIQAVRQLVFQRLREAEREQVFKDYSNRIGDIVSGSVQQILKGDIIVNLGRTEAVLPLKEQIHSEKYKQGQPIRALMLEIQKTSKGPQVILSRTHPNLLIKLIQLEVPEIYEGIVEIKGAVREPGDRAKIAVYSKNARVDPVGACVGLKGSRIQSVTRELSGEKIDIVTWSPDLITFVIRALAPAKDLKGIMEEKEQRITVIAPDSQLTLAIGKKGQNVRLAARLTGVKIDLLSESAYKKHLEAIEKTKILTTNLPLGPKIKEKLIANGIDTAQKIMETSLEKLCEIPGIGKKTAEKIHKCTQEIIETTKEKLGQKKDTEVIEGGQIEN